MEHFSWLNFLYLIIGIPGVFVLFTIAHKSRELFLFFFGFALTSLLIGMGADFTSIEIKELVAEWGDLVAITFVLSGLFVKIRNSKPVFARFPIYLTFLPFLGIPFYPLVIDADIVKDLLSITYYGGALLVAILVSSINQFKHKNRYLLITACIFFFIAFALNFIEKGNGVISVEVFQQMGLLVGIICTVLGFKKIYNTSYKEEY